MALCANHNCYSNNIIISNNRILHKSLGFPYLSRIQIKLSRLCHKLINSRPSSSTFTATTASSGGASSSPTAKTVADADVFQFEQNPDTPLSSPAHSCTCTTTTSSAKWSEFASNVSGEWDGYGAEFTSEGQPIELPESVVPEAYREWEVKVFDWQTQCPTLAQPHHFIANYSLIKLLPTVGCEADAATRYRVDERIIVGDANNNTSTGTSTIPSTCTDTALSALKFAYRSSGCYTAVWALPMDTEDHAADNVNTTNTGSGSRLLELEHCLIHPQNRESRIRIILVVRTGTMGLVLDKIKVFLEQWYGPYRNGDQLGGCAIRDSAFAATDPLQSSQVTGVWQGLNAVARFQNSPNILQELVDDCVRKSIREERDLILLPKQLWCSLKMNEDGHTSCEVGWLLDQQRALTSKCIFSSRAELKEIAIACETAM